LVLAPYETKNKEAREFPVNDYLAEILQEQETVTIALERNWEKSSLGYPTILRAIRFAGLFIKLTINFQTEEM
jgi:hypothetical protein